VLGSRYERLYAANAETDTYLPEGESRLMTAKTKRTTRAGFGDAAEASAELQEQFGIQFRALKRHEELMEEVRALRRAGKIRESKGVEGRAHQVEQLLGALEGVARPSSRPS
jgi:hypothetical protein